MSSPGTCVIRKSGETHLYYARWGSFSIHWFLLHGLEEFVELFDSDCWERGELDFLTEMVDNEVLYVDFDNKVALLTQDYWDEIEVFKKVFLKPVYRLLWPKWRVFQTPINPAQCVGSFEDEVKSIVTNNWQLQDEKTLKTRYYSPVSIFDLLENGDELSNCTKYDCDALRFDGLTLLGIKDNNREGNHLFFVRQSEFGDMLLTGKRLLDHFPRHESVDLQYLGSKGYLPFIEAVIVFDSAQRLLKYATLLPPMHQAHVEHQWPNWTVENVDFRRLAAQLGLQHGASSNADKLVASLDEFLAEASFREKDIPRLREQCVSYLDGI